jgi:hypothetical protein
MKTKKNLLSILVVALLPAMSLAQPNNAAEITRFHRDIERFERERLEVVESRVVCRDTRNKKGPVVIRLLDDTKMQSKKMTGQWASWDENVSVHFAKSAGDKETKYTVMGIAPDGKRGIVREGSMSSDQKAKVLSLKVPWLKCAASEVVTSNHRRSKEEWSSVVMDVGIGLSIAYMNNKMYQGPISRDPSPPQPLNVLGQQMSRPVATSQSAN